MTSILPLAESDRDDWLPLWLAYLEFYETELSDEQTALTFSRLVDPDYPLYGAIARDAGGRPIGIVHWLTHRRPGRPGRTATSRTSSCPPRRADQARDAR